MGRFRHFLTVLVLTALSTLGLRYLFSFILALPIAASAEAGPIDTMFNAHFWMIAFLFSLIMVFMLYSTVVFRRKEGDETDGPHFHSNNALEITWTVVPTIIVLGFGFWGMFTLNDLIRPKPGEMVVQVTGKQWVWSFSYPEQGGFVSSELVLPVDQPIKFEMESKDVLHSFWVPEFRVKQDLVPGRKTYVRATPNLEGEYVLRCAEICGLNHTLMEAPVRVLSQEAFDAWVVEKNAAPKFGEMTAEERGAYWHSAEGFGCIGCHSVNGTPGAGPTWQGLYGKERPLADGSTVLADDAYIRNSILLPNSQIAEGFNPNIMPQNYEEQFATRQAEILAAEGVEIDIIADIIAYMATLSE